MDTSLFNTAVQKIEAEYSQLDAHLGWRFLYTPASTLSCPNGTLFVGINPGGAQYRVTPSVEEGNAYRTEAWAENGRSTLQLQVEKLFSRLLDAGAISGGTVRDTLDRTLTSNFCPFRAPAWDQLPQRTEAKEFSANLWGWLLPRVRPSAIICMGGVPYHQFTDILNAEGPKLSETHWPTGWGNVRFKARTYSAWETRILITFVPHLSRFSLLGREESEPHIGKLADVLRQHHLQKSNTKKE